MKFLIVILALCMAQPVSADELEELVRQQNSLERRLAEFLKKHKVRKPKFYAKIITAHPMPDRKKKVLAAILVPESRGDANAVSSKGAQGPWQVMPVWKRILKIRGSLKDPVVCLNAAVKVYDAHLREAGNEHGALYGYSGGSRWYPVVINKLVAEI